MGGSHKEKRTARYHRSVGQGKFYTYDSGKALLNFLGMW